MSPTTSTRPAEQTLPWRGTDPWYRTFHDLMPNRVREILLVSSPYDAFILEEDGRLTERIFTEYSELNLSTSPRITHVSTAARAFELLAERRFDLVLTMVRIADTEVGAFAQQIKQKYPAMPVVLLVLTEADLTQLRDGSGKDEAIDYTFWWTGDAQILLAIVKLIEDKLNAPHDTSTAGVRAIIVVEDSVRRYSSFLSLLYAELMTQSGSLVAEGVNDLQRLMRMRARPKLLLARDYEEAMELYRRYREYVVALISDVRFPKGGEEYATAGFDLVKAIRAEDPDLAILMQSAEPENAERARQLGVQFAHKTSSNLLRQIRQFVTESLGFGEFVFRTPDRAEVARARDMYELEERLRTVPLDSLKFHATRNHFSTWLMARSMFGLARQLRPRTIEELGGTEGLRSYLIQALEEARIKQQEGVITDFSSRQPGNQFVRLGKGSIGGKARGLAFVNSLLVRYGMDERFQGLRVRIPRSLAIPTGEFDKFIEANRIHEAAAARVSEQAMLERCLAGRLSEDLRRDLRKAVDFLRGPLAVRSSSLLEDSQLQPFAGIYATYMLPNNHPDPEVRFEQLCQAVKAVYASTFSDDARAYIAGTPYSIEEEKMAVLIQELVGQPYGKRFYPAISGVAVSYNYYPVGHQKADEGLAMVALGLGAMIVQGGTALQFSPSSPSVLPQFGSCKDYLEHSQSRFYAVDLSRQTADLSKGPDAFLTECDLGTAEEDGTLGLVGSVYSYDDDLIRDNLSLPGARVVTFNNILKWEALPLAPALADLLKLLRVGLGCAVEMELALDPGDWGRAVPPGRSRRLPCLYVLQVRPQATQMLESHVETEGYPRDQVLCHTDRSLGHGAIEGIQDVVIVKRNDLEANETPAVADQVGALNAKLIGEKRPYLLIGPGRWGSSDSRLGIPVKWAQIAGAKVIVETDFSNREVEPSQGSHFFHNVTSFRIGYLTLSNLDRRATSDKRYCNLGWLLEQPNASETSEVRHIRLEKPLRVMLDGRNSVATILKPE